MRKVKRVKVYSISLSFIALLLLVLPNLSWKTDHKVINKNDTKVTKTSVKHTEIASAHELLFADYAGSIYEHANLEAAGLDYKVFEKALTGYLNLKAAQKLNDNKSIVTIVDFSRSSSTKRMWIVDLDQEMLLLHTYVAHGQGSGTDMADAFSNQPESHQSSLGFYITNETYTGKHGISLRLDGIDKGFNDLARNRDIVVHGASYVSEDFIRQNGRLGRSFGCPAVPMELTDTVIDLIKNKTLLFINGKNSNYTSAYLDGSKLNQEAATFSQS